MAYDDNFNDFMAWLRDFDPTVLGFEYDAGSRCYRRDWDRIDINEFDIEFRVNETLVKVVDRDDPITLRAVLLDRVLLPEGMFFPELLESGMIGQKP